MKTLLNDEIADKIATFEDVFDRDLRDIDSDIQYIRNSNKKEIEKRFNELEYRILERVREELEYNK